MSLVGQFTTTLGQQRLQQGLGIGKVGGDIRRRLLPLREGPLTNLVQMADSLLADSAAGTCQRLGQRQLHLGQADVEDVIIVATQILGCRPVAGIVCRGAVHQQCRPADILLIVGVESLRRHVVGRLGIVGEAVGIAGVVVAAGFKQQQLVAVVSGVGIAVALRILVGRKQVVGVLRAKGREAVARLLQNSPGQRGRLLQLLRVTRRRRLPQQDAAEQGLSHRPVGPDTLRGRWHVAAQVLDGSLQVVLYLRPAVGVRTASRRLVGVIAVVGLGLDDDAVALVVTQQSLVAVERQQLQADVGTDEAGLGYVLPLHGLVILAIGPYALYDVVGIVDSVVTPLPDVAQHAVMLVAAELGSLQCHVGC